MGWEIPLRPDFMKRLLLTLALVPGTLGCIWADDNCDSLEIHFRQGRHNVDTTYMDNARKLSAFAERIGRNSKISAADIVRVHASGAASPEGSLQFNRWLSRKRAEAVLSHIFEGETIPDSVVKFTFTGRDWHGLADLVETDYNLPFHQDLKKLIQEILDANTPVEPDGAPHLARLKAFHGGIVYRYLYRNLFPQLRTARLKIWTATDTPTDTASTLLYKETGRIPEIDAYMVDHLNDNHIPITPNTQREQGMCAGIHTNLLLCALAMPNLGIDLWLGKRFSLSANWTHAWWHSDRRKRYWRLYGGDLGLHRWFGLHSKRRVFSGHHAGLYIGAVTYDFEWGGTGEMGGKPGGTILDRCSLRYGAEYGFSLTLARSLRLDFSLGMGYFGGLFHRYTPGHLRGQYHLDTTRRRVYFGPTKLSVAFMWIIKNRGPQ